MGALLGTLFKGGRGTTEFGFAAVAALLAVLQLMQPGLDVAVQVMTVRATGWVLVAYIVSRTVLKGVETIREGWGSNQQPPTAGEGG